MTANVAPDPDPLPPDSPWEIPYFRFKKNLRDAKTRGWTLTTNAFGFRGKDVAVPKPAGAFRIVCVGGSTTEEGPDSAHTYPALLEQKLRAAFPGRSIEVVNAGTSGMTTRKHIARLADYLALEPDLIVLYEGVNDASIDLPMEWHMLDARLWQKVAAKSRFLQRYLNGLFYPPRPQIEQDVQDLTVANLSAIHAAAQCQGVPMALCSIPGPSPALLNTNEREFYDWDARTHWKDPLLSLSAYSQTRELINEALRAFASHEGILYIPLAEKMQGGAEMFADICHMRDTGIERKAELVFQYLSDYLKPTLGKQ